MHSTLIGYLICCIFFTTFVNSKSDIFLKSNKFSDRETDVDEVYNKLELERQNNITQRIFANYLERKLFPHRKPQNRIPTIEEILPKTTSRPRRFSKPKKNKNSNENDDGKNIEVDNNEEDEVDTTDDEALQTVESEQHDLYDFNEDDPRLNEVFNDCPNCVDDSQYPNKWTMPLLRLGDKKFYLGIFFKANWFKATQYCRYHGMHLASINSQEENDKLEKHIRDFGLGHEHFWTSGTDLAEEGNFFWMATGRPITFTNWNAGEPNNFRYENGEEENCLELWNRDGKGLKWNDSPCSFETYFVCEIQAN